MTLTITASFPTGWYFAHDSHGRPEWPPHPARLITAILTAAYTHKLHIPHARALFDVSPPRIYAPPQGDRDNDWRRWVPVDPDVNERTGTIARSGKLLKEPERGTHVGDGLVHFVFDTSPRSDALIHIGELLLNVPYLGRPTSPVILWPSTHTPPLEPGHTEWTPDPAGPHLLRTTTTDLLTRLDHRELEREQSGTTGHHPRVSHRPTTRYSINTPAPVSTPRLASRTTSDDALSAATVYYTPTARPEHLLDIISALRYHLDDLATLIPLTGMDYRQGRPHPRLYGVATIDTPPTGPIDVLYDGVVRTLQPHLARAHKRERATIAQAYATSQIWTTITPHPAHPDTLTAQLHEAARLHKAQLLHAITHVLPHHQHATHLPHRNDLTHITFKLDRSITGPVVINNIALMPPETEGVP